MYIFRFLSLAVLVGALWIGSVGGCGGGGDNDRLNVEIGMEGDTVADLIGQGGGSSDPPPQPVCQSPPLNTDFSDTGIFFLDTVHAVLMGITSTGDEVVMVLSDVPNSGVIVAVIASAITDDFCIVDFGIVDDSADLSDLAGSVLFQASGNCSLEANGGVFELNSLRISDVSLGANLSGVCIETQPLVTTSSFNALEDVTFDIVNERFQEVESNTEDGFVKQLAEEIMLSQ